MVAGGVADVGSSALGFIWKKATAINRIAIHTRTKPTTGIIAPIRASIPAVENSPIDDFADTAYLWKVGEKIFNLERMFNVREGFGRKDDVFPRRFTGEPMPDGPSAGQVFEAEPLLADYYRVRGWNVKTGIPSRATLNKVGLGFTISK